MLIRWRLKNGEILRGLGFSIAQNSLKIHYRGESQDWDATLYMQNF